MLNKLKLWIIGTGIIGGIALAATIGLTPEGIPFIEVNGELIVFEYTDDNTGENLIIRTDKQTYGGWEGTDMYLMVENISGEKQETKIKFIDPEQSGFLAGISRLEKDVPYQITVDDYATSSYGCGYNEWTNGSTTKTWIDKICERKEIIGNHQETRYRDEWQALEDFEDEAEFALPKNKTAYFKAHIEFPHDTEGEFEILTTGDKQGWGHLK